MHDFEALTNRIKKNLKLLRKWSVQNCIDAFRIYDRDMPEFPFFIDLYGDKLHMQEYDTGWKISEENYEKWISGVRESILKATGFTKESIYFKRRSRKKGMTQYEKQSSLGLEYKVREGNNLFLVNLEQYIDTGLFLDHRPMRLYVGAHARDKKVLNLFCYTASFTVHAATGGAVYSESVDLSNTYIEWARRNFVLNELDFNMHHLIRQDVFLYLNNAITQGKKFDLIILDPPSFSNSKKMRGILDIQEDHVVLIHQVMQLLNLNGLLIFSNNFRDFKMSPSVLREYQVVDKSFVSIPRDFRNKRIHQCWWISHSL